MIGVARHAAVDHGEDGTVLDLVLRSLAVHEIRAVDRIVLDRERLLGMRVHARVPIVVGEQEAQRLLDLAHDELELAVGAAAVSARGSGLPKHVVGDTVLMMQFHEAQRRAVLRDEGEASGMVGHAGCQRGVSLVHRIAIVRRIQVERRPLHGVTQLVDLRHGAFGHVHQVELQRQVGVLVTALHVVELQRVVRAVAEGIAIELGCIEGVALGSTEHRGDGGGIVMRVGIAAQAAIVGVHLARGEVDGETRAIVNAAHVANEHAVDEDPDVVVSGEVEDHLLAVLGDAVGRLHEIRGQRKAEVMVHRMVVRGDRALQPTVRALALEHALRRIEGEELAELLITAAARNGAGIVERKGIALGVIGREVALAVVIVIAVIVQLEQPGGPQIGALAVEARAVEQVLEGLGRGEIGRVALDVLMAGRQPGEAVGAQRGLHDIGEGLRGARPVIDAAARVAAEDELLLIAVDLVDAHGEIAVGVLMVPFSLA